MARQTFELAVFAWLREKPRGRFVPAGLLNLSEIVGANPQNRALTSRFSYGTGYLKRPEAVEVDPVSLSLADREAILGQELFPVNGLGEFGGIRDAAPDAWGRRVIEARRKAPANTLSEAEYLLAAGGDRVGALDVRPDIRSPDSPSASDMRSLEYVMQAAEAVEQGLPVPENLEPFLGAGPSAGGARPKASVRDEQGALWLAKFPGAHIRRACFLWEWLTGQSLPVNAMTMGGYVDLFPGDIYVVGDAPANNPKFRVRDNALGTRDFCPTVRREALPSAVAGINVNFCTVERKIPEREILLASFFKLADNFPNGK